ncbi:MAG: hypothetical protein ABJA82_19110 [Myxococcales bacterium]
MIAPPRPASSLFFRECVLFAGAPTLAVALAILVIPPGCAKVEQRAGEGTGGASGGSTTPVATIPGLVSLTVSPPNDSVELTDNNGQIGPVTRMFTAQGALDDQSTTSVTDRVNWTISPRTGGTISHGVVTIAVPGIYTVTASSGAINAHADLVATFKGNRFGQGFSAANATKLDGTPSGSLNVAYPLDGAIFPSNFGKVTFQFAKTGGQDSARLRFVGDGLEINYYGACEATPAVGGGCYITVPSEVTKWFVAASSQRDLTFTARLGSAAGGGVAESAPMHLAWADVPLLGGLYYWTTINPGAIPGYTAPDPMDPRGTAVMRYNFGGDTPVRELVWTDRGTPKTTPPFQESPPAVDGTDPESGRYWGAGRCIGCHAISPDGNLMAFSIGGSDASSWALLNIGSSTLNLLEPPAPPPTTTGVEAQKPYRKGKFATFTTFGPKSDLMVNMYRGKLSMRQVDANLMVVRDNLFSAATMERKSDPFWSPDGMHFAFVSYDLGSDTQTSRFNGDTKVGGQIWAATADVTGPHEDAKVIVPRQVGVTSYYPAISHDGRLLVFNKSQCSGPANPGNYGTAPCDGYDDITATLWLTDPDGGTPVPLNLANGGAAGAGAWPTNSNSWPRWSPDSGGFRGQQLYWLAFSSRRPYGMQVNSGAGTGAKPQLWFSAVLTGKEFSTDPSHPPVWLPDQNLSIEQPTGNHVPQWVKFVVPIK